jgi:serine phosphatase RsbU (regulator of sigma subunit)
MTEPPPPELPPSGPTPSGFHRLESALLRERRLNAASTALHTTLDIDELLQMILHAACEGVMADRGIVFLVTPAGDELWSRVLEGDQSLDIRLPMGQGIAGTVAATGEPISIHDAYDDPRFDRSWDDASGYRTRQILCRPILNRDGRVTGVFQVLNKKDGDFERADETYLDALSVHAALALENAQLHLSALEQERQSREILLVQDVQRAYQPERATLEVGRVRAAGMNLLCEDASGDYYDFIPLERGRHAVVIGDVSGHGLKSALIMAQARAFLRAFCSTVDSLDEIMNRLDACLGQDLSGGLFMCLFIAVIDPETGGVEWSNAGNPPPFIVRAKDGTADLLPPTGRILGILPNPDHGQGEPTKLEPGDVLLLYTDGATEARRPDGTMYEEQRLIELIGTLAERDPADIVEGVNEALCEWTGVSQMDDDLTLVAVKVVAP